MQQEQLNANNNEGYIQNIGQFLEANPQIVQLIHEVHKKREEYNLLNFIQRQQQIMKEQLINDKIPFVKLSVEKLKLSIEQKRNKIEAMQSSIEETKTKIQLKRRRCQQQCNKKRELLASCKMMENQINAISKNHKVERKICNFHFQQPAQRFQQMSNMGNNQNADVSNVQSEKNERKQQSGGRLNNSHLQVLDLVNVKTANAMLVQKIDKQKMNVQRKICQMRALKNILKSKQQKNGGDEKIVGKGVCKQGGLKIQNNSSIVKSQWMSIE